MKITISPTGEIQMDTNGSSPAEIAATILSVQRELRKDATPKPSSAPVELSTISSTLWDWLVDNDTERGIHIQAVANHFAISKDAASQRCTRLVDEGHANRVSTARYRAVTG